MAVTGTAVIMAGGTVTPQIQRHPPIALPVAPHARSAAPRPTLGDATVPNVAQPWCPAIVRTAMRTSPRVLSSARIAARRSSPELGVIPHAQAHDPQPPWVPVPYAHPGDGPHLFGTLRMGLLAGRQTRQGTKIFRKPSASSPDDETEIEAMP